MTPFLLYWILSGLASAAVMGASCWWTIKKARLDLNSAVSDRQLTMRDLLIVIMISAVPILSTVIVVFVLLYMFSEIAPKIVLFGDDE